MPSKKQQRRRQKLKRHEYEEVYVDELGRELDPEEAEQLVATQPARNARSAKAAKPQPTRRGGRAIEPPSWRRTFRKTVWFFPLMLAVVFVLSPELNTATKVVRGITLMIFFVPFSYFMDGLLWRMSQKRLARDAEAKKS
jgi:cytochrome c-type biogenesis protein CcmH/NrfG